MDKLTDAEKAVIKKALLEPVFQNIIGAEEWSLTEPEEMILWDAIHKLEEITDG